LTEHNALVSKESSPAQFVGVVLLALSALMWSLNGVLIKTLTKDDSAPGGVTIACFRSLVAGLCLLPLTRGKWGTLAGRSASGRRLSVRPAALGGMVLFTLMTVTFVLAMTKTETANALILQYTSTFWIFALSPWLLRELPRREDVRLLIIAVPGIGIIFAGNATADVVGLTIALASGLFFALLTMLLRHLRESDPVAVTVFNNLGAALLLLPFCIAAGGLMVSQRAVVLLVIMGVVQFGVPYYLYSLGLARVPAAQAALVTLLEPVLAPLWTYLVIGETVPTMTMIGGSLILLALGMFARNARARRLSALEVLK
jgi:drug/metabolite transporter (DMT)-like permease